MDGERLKQTRTIVEKAEEDTQQATDRLEQARLKAQVAQTDLAAARQSFSNWIATRRATERAEQDPEVIERTRALDALQAREREAQAAIETEQQKLLDAEQVKAQAEREQSELRDQAQGSFFSALRAQELRVFSYRLTLTLPLLALAGWLFARKRTSRWWPFVWGFILFAVFTFFVELVPYMPSYGGYVRYVVGILVTALVGRWAIVALQRYLDRQRAAEAQPELQRREAVDYDQALARMSKGVCPGCERVVDMKSTEIDFCPHCGLGLFNRCGHCSTRKNAFSLFCHACGTRAAHPAPAPSASEMSALAGTDAPLSGPAGAP
jgi:predicted RNA-binding Zn-ribbon protein involved in translation (DUF1610 family)